MSSRNGFPPIGSVTVALGEVHVLFGFVSRCPCRALAAVTSQASSRLSSLREVAIVLCRRDCSQLIPSQGTAHDHREQLGPETDPGRCGRIWCEFLTARATPYTATCWPASPIADESRRIHGPTQVGPNGRDLKLPQGNSDRTTGPKRVSRLILLYVRVAVYSNGSGSVVKRPVSSLRP